MTVELINEEINVEFLTENSFEVALENKKYGVEFANVVAQIPVGQARLEVEISASEIVDGLVEIGTISGGKLVNQVVVIVEERFNNDAMLTIGDSDAQGRLSTVFDTDLSEVGTSIVECFVEYPDSTLLKAYFLNESTVGKLKIIIIYS